MVKKFVLYGATGDLSARQIMPGLYQLWCAGQLPPDFQIIALGLEEWSTETYRTKILDSMKAKKTAQESSARDWDKFAQHIVYIPLNLEANDELPAVA
jgi:glucose-6-phosphate 1-dehydrogenase